MGQGGRFSSLMEITPKCRETDTVIRWLALHLALLFISDFPPFPCGAHKRFHASLFGVALGCSQAPKQLWVKPVSESSLCQMLGCRAPAPSCCLPWRRAWCAVLRPAPPWYLWVGTTLKAKLISASRAHVYSSNLALSLPFHKSFCPFQP